MKRLDITLLQDFAVRTIAETITVGELTRSAGRVAEGRTHALPVQGDLVGAHYRLLELLGEGMFGRVYLAERTDVPEHRVALKVMTRAVYAGRDVERELVMLAAANHPHIVQLKDHGMTDDYVWLTMPLYEGETLAARLERGTLGLREAYEIFLPIARGLEALHARGLRHQDVKPENIFLARFSGRPHPVLLDLGVAVERNASFVAGTVLYGAPEQIMALGGARSATPLDERIDAYCLAATLLRSLVDASAFPGDGATTPYELARAYEERETAPLRPAALPELAGEPRRLLAEAFRGWLAQDPDRRAGVGRLADEIEVLLEQEREAARRIEISLGRQKRTLGRARLALGAVLLAAAGGAAYGYSKRQTLRLAAELERARAAGAARFDALDTCTAAHELSRRETRACESDRAKDADAHRSSLADVAAATEQVQAAWARRLTQATTRLRTCEDQATSDRQEWERAESACRGERDKWQDAARRSSESEQQCRLDRKTCDGDRHALQTRVTELAASLSEHETAWEKARAKLAGERDEHRRGRQGCEASLAGALATQSQCRADLASCLADRKPAPPPPPAPAPAPPSPAGADGRPAGGDRG